MIPLSAEVKDLIRLLLEKDPRKRLGIKNGIEDIKKHAFFKGIDWNRILAKDYKESQPTAYLAEMAMQIIKKQPFALKDHPRTKGKLSQKGDLNHFDDWEINTLIHE